MSIFRKIFKKKLDVNSNNTSEQIKTEKPESNNKIIEDAPIETQKDFSGSPIELIETKLKVSFPKRFIEFINSSLPKDKEVYLELLDGEYKFLDSLFSIDVKNDYEDVVYVSKLMDSPDYPEDKAFVKIPFAKSTEGDGFKYLYFLCEENSESSEKILLRDIDSPMTGRIPICIELPFILRKIGEVNNRFIVSNQTLNFSDANRWIDIPEYINIWKDSYQDYVGKSSEQNRFRVELFLINYLMNDSNKNFSKIEVQLSIICDGDIVSSALAFEVDKAGLRFQFEDNINYRIFYHKLVCIIGTIATTLRTVKEQHEIDIDKFISFINSQDLRKIGLKGFKQIETRGE